MMFFCVYDNLFQVQYLVKTSTVQQSNKLVEVTLRRIEDQLDLPKWPLCKNEKVRRTTFSANILQKKPVCLSVLFGPSRGCYPGVPLL